MTFTFFKPNSPSRLQYNKKFFYLLQFVVILGLLPIRVSGQETPPLPDPDTMKLKLYLDCRDCDFAFFRRNIAFVDFVRDPDLSDVHLLVTEQRTASNGRSYGLNFIGSGNYSDLNYKLVAVTQQSDTELQTWEKLLRTTRLGLMPFVSRTSEVYNLKVEYLQDSVAVNNGNNTQDNWNFWVIRLDMGTDLELEESQKEYSGRGSARVDRITEKLKFRSDVMYFRTLESFKDEQEIIESRMELIDSDAELVFSLGPHWSAGIFNEFRSSTYDNTDLSWRIGPAIEYNFFPWSQSDRRIFSIAYHIQVQYLNYTEITIFDLMEELRARESVRVSLIMRQPWGEVETRLEGSHFFHDLAKNRLDLESRISINVTRGLAFFTEINAGLIHDQLYLPAGEISREELLLRQRQLETSYEISGEFGISFTFGSIYNNIVNQRL